MKKTIAFGALVLAAVAGSASAGVQTSSFSYGPNLVPYGGTGTLAMFDDNGGLYVLKNIVITYSVSLSANVSVTALSGPQAVDVGVVGNANATDSLFSLPVSLTGSWTSPVLNSGDIHNFGTLTVSNFASYTVPTPLWPLYTGAGTFNVNYIGSGLFGVQGGGNATIDVTNFGGSGTVTVQYFYNIIPTPGAMALLGMGGLLAGRRRR